MRAVNKNTVREISKSRNRFLSIFLICAIGVGFFSGVRATCDIMKTSADDYYDAHDLFDLRVLSTFGLTDDDASAIAEIDGVDGVYTSKYTDLALHNGDEEYLTRVYSKTPDEVNKIDIFEGSAPQAENECVVSYNVLHKGINVGDTITLEDVTKADEFPLKYTEYKVVGIYDTPMYISITQRGSTNIGDGAIDAFMIVPAEHFTQDVYTEIYIKSDRLHDMKSYSDEYAALRDEISNKLEKLGKERSVIRYNDVIGDAQAEIDKGEKELAEAKEDGQRELADAKRELSDAKKQIEDGEKELSDAGNEISDGEIQLSDAEKELADAWEEIEDGKRELAENKPLLDDAKRQLDDAKKEIEDGEKQLADGKKALDEAKEQIEQAKTDLYEGRKQYDDGKKELDDAQAEVDSARKSLSSGYSQISSAQSEIDRNRAELNNGKAQLEEARQQIADGEVALEQAREVLRQAEEAVAQLDPDTDPQILQYAEMAVQAARDGVAQAEAQIEDGKAQIAENEQMIADGEAQLADAQRQVDEGWDDYYDGRNQLDAAQKQIDNGRMELAEAKEQLDNGERQITDGLAEYAAGLEEYLKNAELLAEGKSEYVKGMEEYTNGLAEYTEGMQKLADGEVQYYEGLATVAEKRLELVDGKQQYEDGLAELEEAKQKYADGLTEYEDGVYEFEREIAKAEKELADAKAKIADVGNAEWYVFTRDDNTGYSEYSSNAERIGKIAAIFPVFFLLVAGLVCLTTMSRMVEEQRTQVGTLKALGYSNGAIMRHYMSYAVSGAAVGGVIGAIGGCFLFPTVIVYAYSMMYNIVDIHYLFTPENMIVSIGSMILAIAATVFFSCNKALRETPASLMRPKAPKAGKRVLIERIPFIWNRMNFFAKVSGRNLFRYKRRMFMTVVGIAGCTALSLTGFGLKDSISDIVDLQYREIYKYSGYMAYDEEIKPSELRSIYDTLLDYDENTAYTRALIKQYGTEFSGNSVQVYVTAVEDAELFERFIDLHERVSREKLSLTDGAVITEKAAKLLGAELGDEITLRISDGVDRRVKIAGITEHYAGHYLYISEELYKEVFGSAPDYNMIYFDNGISLDENLQNSFTEHMLKNENVLAVIMNASSLSSVHETLQTMNLVTIVLIVSAAALAFVVLYNLTNVNITERIREIATLKVLGFYDAEVSSYVFRENIILSAMGGVVGLFLGHALCMFVITTAEIDEMMFGRSIHVPSYVWSLVVTVAFSLIVNLIMTRVLKKISMVESLKSVE
ncbi:MAG: ABC transporter permease [Lachnospiraceae bacterium]|nr:ABC transporter permease [Ruminococcus sp.]MCM1274774.1 ABC transporter permease [Lachnospiraceae bacterium]